jgi:heptosyltransferase-2
VKLFRFYDSPSFGSRMVMAAGDLLTHLLVPFRPKPQLPLHKARTKKLLLLRLDGIGDNICSWPALQFIRGQLPDTHIALAVGPWAAPLYRECPWIDEVIEWDSALFGLFRGKGLRGITTDIFMTQELRQRNFDAGIDLRGDLLSIFLLWLVAPPIRIGQITRGGSRLLTDPLLITPGHETERTFSVVRTISESQTAPASRVHDWSRPCALSRVNQRLQAEGWDVTRPTAAICPEALWPWKRWPQERFRELANRLSQELGLQVVWVFEHLEQFEPDEKDIVFSGSLDEVAAVLSLCKLAVCSDSGLLHLAVAANCNTVQLFGPGDAERFAHSGEGLVLHHDRSCSGYPCVQRGTCVNLPSGWCLEKISVNEVFASCQLLVASPSDKVTGSEET